MRTLIVATSNPGKLAEMQNYLASLNSWELALKPPDLEVEETGTTFMENARLKAKTVAKATKNCAIADDSGLAVEALNGAPGIYSARYADTDEERIARVLRELGDSSNRKAKFVCACAIALPDGKIALEKEGICEGEILTTPRGNNGFGYDPIFYVPSVQKTFAEMDAELKKKLSHRGQAFAALFPEILTIADKEGAGNPTP
ncbi:RdgB/HAM1 family non-canonical purine NTP pyrophosphatase [Euhalothece natronophila Z-M001]|uniref:dITP/XTP pyrophosphatase n=1 Tax=Euhalothece natronophila Z-M001 TaxID=522448 RepID=A0A5B8NKF1_9CHRO|nr:RdgB/HAM1 family non-canonical purine NTP pyrophosphatase [Euhalothece natronophila]QDZ39456.1 RdgB/HAM1 family non-canonical purine NTP pyrophosphatase [Euhalothece natronophila Z-M001]